MNLAKWVKKLSSDFKSASKLDKVIFIVAMAAAAGLLFEHGFIHTGIVKFSAGKAKNCSDVLSAKTYTIEIKDTAFSPAEVQAKTCDRLRFVNKEDTLHEPAFGAHPAHLGYPGYEEKVLLKEESNEFVLSLPGRFSFHDHLNDEIEGSLNVNP